MSQAFGVFDLLDFFFFVLMKWFCDLQGAPQFPYESTIKFIGSWPHKIHWDRDALFLHKLIIYSLNIMEHEEIRTVREEILYDEHTRRDNGFGSWGLQNQDKQKEVTSYAVLKSTGYKNHQNLGFSIKLSTVFMLIVIPFQVPWQTFYIDQRHKFAVNRSFLKYNTALF